MHGVYNVDAEAVGVGYGDEDDRFRRSRDICSTAAYDYQPQWRLTDVTLLLLLVEAGGVFCVYELPDR